MGLYITQTWLWKTLQQGLAEKCVFKLLLNVITPQLSPQVLNIPRGVRLTRLGTTCGTRLAQSAGSLHTAAAWGSAWGGHAAWGSGAEHSRLVLLVLFLRSSHATATCTAPRGNRTHDPNNTPQDIKEKTTGRM